jgi:hypothetical protein
MNLSRKFKFIGVSKTKMKSWKFQNVYRQRINQHFMSVRDSTANETRINGGKQMKQASSPKFKIYFKRPYKLSKC